MNKCEQIEDTITFCWFYENREKCSECDSNYLVSKDGKNCIRNSGTSFCNAYSLISCMECEDDYILNKNLSYKDLIKFETESQKR